MIGNKGRTMSKFGKSKQKKLSKRQKAILAFLCIVILAGTSMSLIMGYYSYHQSVALVQTGAQHLRNAETLLQTLAKQPSDEQTIEKAQQEFSLALSSFTQINAMVQIVPQVPASISPSLSAASHLVPLAVSGSQAGVLGCQLLKLFISKFHNLSNTQGQGLTMGDMELLNQKFALFTQALAQVVSQSKQVKSSDLQSDPRLGKMFGSLQKQIPAIEKFLSASSQIQTLAPVLLGVSSPAKYLVEVLDSTELRPGGGFVGSYGIVTITGGRLVSAPITDTTLLDHPFELAGGKIALPSTYSWFDLVSNWSLRDSNLSADFPTNARYAEQNYQQEGGKDTFLGVIAITPTLIQRVLDITGSIQVPEYHETVTAKNLISLIHTYQLGQGHESGYIPSSDGYSSQRKHFTALLAKNLLDRVKTIMPTMMPRFLQLMKDAIGGKDLQIYFNSSQVESLLHSYSLDSSIQPTSDDGLMVVNANIGVTKANLYIVSKLIDQVTIDTQGNAVHHTSINYSWTIPGPYFGHSTYRDYVQIYAPLNSNLQSQQGWQSRGTSAAFDHTIWTGFFTLTFGQKLTITLEWTDQSAAKQNESGWHYTYLIQRQPGTQWTYDLQVKLPACATIRQLEGGLTTSNPQTATISHDLDKNTTLGIDYTC